ncbi:MAG: hypothetical protein OXE80_07565, partial [Gammaproteobacteria bacterium]|nr:hypothetical protein [Gammaproteobacteria bacterium]
DGKTGISRSQKRRARDGMNNSPEFPWMYSQRPLNPIQPDGDGSKPQPPQKAALFRLSLVG